MVELRIKKKDLALNHPMASSLINYANCLKVIRTTVDIQLTNHHQIHLKIMSEIHKCIVQNPDLVMFSFFICRISSLRDPRGLDCCRMNSLESEVRLCLTEMLTLS